MCSYGTVSPWSCNVTTENTILNTSKELGIPGESISIYSVRLSLGRHLYIRITSATPSATESTHPYPALSRPHRAPKTRKRPPHVPTAARSRPVPVPGRRIHAILKKDLDVFHTSASGRQERWRQPEVVVRGDVSPVLEKHADYLSGEGQRRRFFCNLPPAGQSQRFQSTTLQKELTLRLVYVARGLLHDF